MVAEQNRLVQDHLTIFKNQDEDQGVYSLLTHVSAAPDRPFSGFLFTPLYLILFVVSVDSLPLS